MIPSEEKRILDKMQAGKKKTTAKELIGEVNPILQGMCIDPRYVTVE